ncbi:hypothetical protein PoB_006710200 [Plakobranchus ocellatus]|uniref:Uncharacterized protein n=1 Tax=Plakobranchus ocellatus TaxID=259542 RepID=A0AAV4D935_9GAST|nr:hypothetical protein PoB_006710200 [Plakobranchus ocellatus]
MANYLRMSYAKSNQVPTPGSTMLGLTMALALLSALNITTFLHSQQRKFAIAFFANFCRALGDHLVLAAHREAVENYHGVDRDSNLRLLGANQSPLPSEPPPLNKEI